MVNEGIPMGLAEACRQFRHQPYLRHEAFDHIHLKGERDLPPLESVTAFLRRIEPLGKGLIL